MGAKENAKLIYSSRFSFPSRLADFRKVSETRKGLPILRPRFVFRIDIASANCIEIHKDTQTGIVIFDRELRAMKRRYCGDKSETEPGALDLGTALEAIKPLKDLLSLLYRHSQPIISNARNDL